MTMRVVLATAPYHHVPGPFQRLIGFAEPPLGLGYLASAIRSSVFDASVEIIDSPALGISARELIPKIVSRNPDLVGFSVTTASVPIVREICGQLKRKLPACRIVAGGSHPSALPGDLLPDVDIAVIGEGEKTIVELITGQDLAEIDGIAYRDNQQMMVNRPRALIENLDELAPPAYDLLPLDRYRYPYPIRTTTRRYATTMASRGCPGRCSFCAKSAVWGDRVRFHSLKRILSDVDELVNRYGVSLLYFYDDTFLSRPETVKEFCKKVRGLGRRLKWICQGRADEVGEDVCRTLVAGGCAQLEIGVECGDQRILDDVGKRIDLDQVRHAFLAARCAGLQTKANFIFGFPGETPASIRTTSRLAVEIEPTYANFFHLVPFPGSALYDLYRRNKWLATDDWGSFIYHGRAVVSVPGASADVLSRAKSRALRRFYLQPRKLIQLTGILFSSRKFGTVLRGFFGFVNELFQR